MDKRKLTEYTGIIIVSIGAALLFVPFYWGAGFLFALYHLLYGFTGLAFFFSTARKTSISNLLLGITLAPTLLPFRKSFYYWTKSVNTILQDSSGVEKAYSFAKKVNVDNLSTDNNRSMFYSYLASLHIEMGNKSEAVECIQIALELPHKKELDEPLNNIKESIYKRANRSGS